MTKSCVRCGGTEKQVIPSQEFANNHCYTKYEESYIVCNTWLAEVLGSEILRMPTLLMRRKFLGRRGEMQAAVGQAHVSQASTARAILMSKSVDGSKQVMLRCPRLFTTVNPRTSMRHRTCVGGLVRSHVRVTGCPLPVLTTLKSSIKSGMVDWKKSFFEDVTLG